MKKSIYQILCFFGGVGGRPKYFCQVGDNDERLEKLREGERSELLHSLKAKWDTVNEKYQLMVRR